MSEEQNVPDNKMKNRFNLMNHRSNTEKLRDLLREKCRIRVKESRDKMFNDSRNLLSTGKEWIAELLKEELKEFEENIELEDLIYKELTDELYQWLVEQYENELDYVASISNPINALCPICQLTELNLEDNVLSCSCGIRLIYNKSLEDLVDTINKAVTQHEETCSKKLFFFVEPQLTDNSTLNAFCKQCDYFTTIV